MLDKITKGSEDNISTTIDGREEDCNRRGQGDTECEEDFGGGGQRDRRRLSKVKYQTMMERSTSRAQLSTVTIEKKLQNRKPWRPSGASDERNSQRERSYKSVANRRRTLQQRRSGPLAATKRLKVASKDTSARAQAMTAKTTAERICSYGTKIEWSTSESTRSQ